MNCDKLEPLTSKTLVSSKYQSWEAEETLCCGDSEAAVTVNASCSYCSWSPPRWTCRSWSCRCFRPGSRSRRCAALLHADAAARRRWAPDSGSYHWTPLEQKQQVFSGQTDIDQVDYRSEIFDASQQWTWRLMDGLTHSQEELQHMHSSFLLQEVHEAKEEILLLPDLLQLQLQHLNNQRKKLYYPHYRTCF